MRSSSVARASAILAFSRSAAASLRSDFGVGTPGGYVREARRVDANQQEIVNTLRDCCCVVEVTSDVGRGFPDLVVRTPRGSVYLVEVKDGAKRPSEQALTDAQVAFSRRWGDSYRVIKTRSQAIALAQS